MRQLNITDRNKEMYNKWLIGATYRQLSGAYDNISEAGAKRIVHKLVPLQARKSFVLRQNDYELYRKREGQPIKKFQWLLRLRDMYKKRSENKRNFELKDLPDQYLNRKGGI